MRKEVLVVLRARLSPEGAGATMIHRKKTATTTTTITIRIATTTIMTINTKTRIFMTSPLQIFHLAIRFFILTVVLQ